MKGSFAKSGMSVFISFYFFIQPLFNHEVP